MKISRIETFVLGSRRMLVKISTDDGAFGWGEPVLEGYVLAVRGAIGRMSEQLIGCDPRQISRLWQLMARGGFYRDGAVLGSAVAGLDQALWDLKGRALGVGVHELLGGPCRDRVRVYAHSNANANANANTDGRTGDPELARRLIQAGLSMIKVAPDGPHGFIESPARIARLVKDLSELRAAVGDEVDIALDLHGRFSAPNAIRLLPLLEPLLLSFVEEPVRPEHTARLADVVRASAVPIATGERLYSCADFAPALAAGIAVAQPDLSHAGGITECFRIATLADVRDVQLAPHCPLGPVALAACLQLDFAIPNFFAQEQTISLHDPATADLGLIANPEVFTLVDGYLPRPPGPGLAIEVDEDAVRAAAIDDGSVAGGSPVWPAADGGFAEW